MTFQQMIARAKTIREKYGQHENDRFGRQWTTDELAEGLVVDVGELIKLVMAKKGIRVVENVDGRLAHELADCLWSIIILAEQYEIDLEQSFAQTMDELEQRLD